ncbi:MAG: hypothetical protein O2819_00190 [Planctomycetota bacterium]|nr:hypothetical protein [Planctomycetota bacterium]MDA1105365.1 hypothetical protein [Planctomycetota bacterium]
MSRRRPSASGSPMSFFSFQDIVAATLGIMILVALLMALDPMSMEPVEPAPRSPEQQTADQAKLDAARAAVAQAQQQLQEAKAQFAKAQEGEPIEEEEVERIERLADDLRKGAEAAQQEEEQAKRNLAATAERLQKSTEKVDQLMRATAAMEAEYALAAKRARVQYRPGDRQDKQPMLVELSQQGATCGLLTGDGVPSRIPGSMEGLSANAAVNAAKVTHQSSDWYLLFVIHPGQEDIFQAAMQEWYGHGYQVGWQLWDPANGSIFDEPEEAPAAGETP